LRQACSSAKLKKAICPTACMARPRGSAILPRFQTWGKLPKCYSLILHTIACTRFSAHLKTPIFTNSGLTLDGSSIAANKAVARK